MADDLGAGLTTGERAGSKSAALMLSQEKDLRQT